MPNDKIRVLLKAPVVKVSSGKHTNSAVLAITVGLTRKGAGPTLASTTPQPAELSFFEMVGTKDAAGKPRKIATLKGTIMLTGSKNDTPQFDAGAKVIEYEPGFVRDTRTGNDAPVHSSDFRLRVAYDGTFINTQDAFVENRSLYLPWEFDEEHRVFELGTELKIGGKVESPPPKNATITVPTTHRAVHDNGNPAEATRAHFGVGMVYPLDNLTFVDHKLSGRIPMPGKTLSIHLHRSIDQGLKGQATIAKVADGLRAIFKTAGITADVHVSRTDAQAQAAGWERKRFSRGEAWVAQSISVADLDQGQTTAPGTVQSFFEYWVFYETKIGSTSGEAGSSEAMLSVDKAKATKALMFPVWLHGGGLSGDGFDDTLSSVAPGKGADHFVANLIAHEVGHSLGLGHGLRVSAGGYDLTKGSTDSTRGIVTAEHSTGGQVVLKGVSPVHRAVLRRDYL